MAYTECACTNSSANDEYCAQWYCERISTDVDDPSVDRDDSSTGVLHTWSECTEPNHNGTGCAAWTTLSLTDADPGSWQSGLLELSNCSCTLEATAEQLANADGLVEALVDDHVYADLVVDLEQSFQGHCVQWTCHTETWDFWTPAWSGFTGGLVCGTLIFFFGHSRMKSRGRSLKGFCCYWKANCLVLTILSIGSMAWLLLGIWSTGFVGMLSFGFVAAMGAYAMYRGGACRKVGDTARVAPDSPPAPRLSRRRRPRRLDVPVAAVAVAEVVREGDEEEIPVAQNSTSPVTSPRIPANITQRVGSSTIPVASIVRDVN